MRKKAGRDNEVSALIDSDVSRKAFRKNWARLIQKSYNVDPLVCPRCHGQLSGVWISSGDLGGEAKPPEHSFLQSSTNIEKPQRVVIYK
jgi:hypothetical protein